MDIPKNLKQIALGLGLVIGLSACNNAPPEPKDLLVAKEC